MSDTANITPVLASTTVSEEARDLAQEVKNFYDRNHVCITVSAVLLISFFMHRSMMRRELKRLRFAVEIVPDESFNYNDWMMSQADVD